METTPAELTAEALATIESSMDPDNCDGDPNMDCARENAVDYLTDSFGLSRKSAWAVTEEAHALYLDRHPV